MPAPSGGGKWKALIIIAILVLVIGGLAAAAFFWHPQLETRDLSGYSYFFLFGRISNFSDGGFILAVDENRADKGVSLAPRTVFFDGKTTIRQFAGVDTSMTTPRNIFTETTAAALKEGDTIAIYSDSEINQTETITATIIERLSPQ